MMKMTMKKMIMMMIIIIIIPFKFFTRWRNSLKVNYRNSTNYIQYTQTTLVNNNNDKSISERCNQDWRTHDLCVSITWYKWGTRKMHTQLWWETMKGRDHLEELGVNGTTEMDFTETGWMGVRWILVTWREGRMTGPCEPVSFPFNDAMCT